MVATFLTAQAFVLQAVGMPLQRAFPDARGWIVMLAMLYGVASLVQYFGRDQARWKVALRAVLRAVQAGHHRAERAGCAGGGALGDPAVSARAVSGTG